MKELGKGVDELVRKRLTDKKALEYMSEFFPATADMTEAQRKNNLALLDAKHHAPRLPPHLLQQHGEIGHEPKDAPVPDGA